MGTEPKLAVGIEPTASPLPRECSSTELREHSPSVPSPTLSARPVSLPRCHTPTGNRTPVSALRTPRPRPLDDGGVPNLLTGPAGLEPATPGFGDRCSTT